MTRMLTAPAAGAIALASGLASPDNKDWSW
jgi:hypothetical protein